MKKYLLLFPLLLVTTGWSLPERRVTAQAAMVSPDIVISQVYGGGGNVSGSQFANDFVELFNRGSQPVNLSGWSTQYASAGGTNWLVTPLSNVTLQPGQYYLVQYASGGANGASLPTPDVIAPAVTVGGNTFIPNLSGTTGKVAVVNSITQLPASSCPSDPSIVDLLGYGSGASCFEGVRTADLSNTTAAKRNGAGCADSDNNSADFTITVPAPRNTATPASTCNLGSNLQAGINANPNFVSPGGNTLITVAVIPATTPPSTGITVVGNLAEIGGLSSQVFFDNGTNGDVTPGDNVFSFRATIPVSMSGGARSITAVASDAQGRTVNLNQQITIDGCPVNDQPLALGNPSNASTDVANENNYLMTKTEYSLSYNRSRAIANWVAWRLESGWVGTAPRQDDFRPDTNLPAPWYQVLDNDYNGSGFDRGHNIPSGDRTCSVPANSSTFLMTNIMPQAANNNQGPWEELETYCRTLASQGNEMYIYSGGVGQGGTGLNGFANTIASGRVVVPAVTWKVIVVLPIGNDDAGRVGKTTRTIAVSMPNHQNIGINTPWRNFRTTVKQVEALTGFNFFTNVRPQTRRIIKQRRDTL